jgi:hypothetical protein
VLLRRIYGQSERIPDFVKADLYFGLRTVDLAFLEDVMRRMSLALHGIVVHVTVWNNFQRCMHIAGYSMSTWKLPFLHFIGPLTLSHGSAETAPLVEMRAAASYP